MTKAEFLKAYGFPDQWLSWGLYPDDLFEAQRRYLADVQEDYPYPAEHIRYGAFLWWLWRNRTIPVATLKQLARLAALDPDPHMADSAAHGILFHPSATEEVADELANADWRESREWARKPSSSREFFHRLLAEGRQFWLERHAAHSVACDLKDNKLSVGELRELFQLGSALVLRGLVEHPSLPEDLLARLTRLEGVRFAKQIRTLSRLRLKGKSLPPSDYSAKYSTDPWSVISLGWWDAVAPDRGTVIWPIWP
jgi:hypothetical protein